MDKSSRLVTKVEKRLFILSFALAGIICALLFYCEHIYSQGEQRIAELREEIKGLVQENSELQTEVIESHERISELTEINASIMLPCPYCGSNEARLVEHMGIRDFYSVVCDKCGTEGPDSTDSDDYNTWFTKDEAIQAWNELPRKEE